MSDRSHVLIVDDDPDIRKVLEILLKNNFFIGQAQDGPSALAYVQAQPDTDLIILDVMMPGMDGFETCRRLRELTRAPILFLTAKSDQPEKLAAYSSGGDDFLSKPFSHEELLAKVGSLLRRYKEYRGKVEGSIHLGELEVDLSARTVKSLGRPVSLTETEYAILEHLVRRRGSTVTTAELYEKVWGEKFLSGTGNTVMVHLLNLRRKIEADPSSPKIIRTVWGKGYKIDG